MTQQGTQSAWKPIHTAPHKGIFLVTDGTQVGLAKATSDGMVVKLFELSRPGIDRLDGSPHR
jgi:hypothetical protein